MNSDYPDQWPQALITSWAIAEAERMENPIREAMESGAMLDDLSLVQEYPPVFGAISAYRLA